MYLRTCGAGAANSLITFILIPYLSFVDINIFISSLDSITNLLPSHQSPPTRKLSNQNKTKMQEIVESLCNGLIDS